MNTNVNFPGFNLYFDNVTKSFNVFGIEIAMYGVLIAIGMILGFSLILFIAKRTKQNMETYYDVTIIGILFGIIGARIYYVSFRWYEFKDDLLSILNLRTGGLGIYGGIILAGIAIFIYSKKKNKKFSIICDTIAPGILVGQIIGRFGNFCNREVFGGYTDSIFRMEIPINAVANSRDITFEMTQNSVVRDGITYISVHPTFLYEALWNLIILLILLIYFKHKKFNGQIMLLYMMCYAVGRFFIEWIRIDQLYLPNTSVPVSQLVAVIIFVVALVLYISQIKKRKRKYKKSKS